VFAAPARAQSADGVFIAAAVEVDVTAANSAEAQRQGLANAEREGFERVARRVTLAAERATLGEPRPDQAALQRMVARVDVLDERRSNTRYIARLSVRLIPDNVRAFLRAAGYTVLETRTSPVLVAAAAPAGPASLSDLWRQTWEEGGYGGELAPILLAPASAPSSPDWSALAPFAQGVGSAAAVVASLSVAGDSASAALVEIGPNGARRDRGVVTARIGPAEAGLARALRSLADQANAVIQDEWKTTLAAGRAQRMRVTLSALFAGQEEWARIKRGLGEAQSSIVSDVSVDAISREGALVSLSFVGDRAAFAREMVRNGLALSDGPLGLELRLR
jgi:hypothetical protein